MGKKVVITGATGLLGRAVMRAFTADKDWEVLGLYLNRLPPSSSMSSSMQKCDLRDTEELRKILTQFQPDIVIHCAAERRAEVCESNPQEAHNFNVVVTENLAKICANIGSWLLYISTDYVFDGKKPPYTSNSETNPLSVYGKTKREGELAVWKNLPDGGVLRLPVLYGPLENLDESAVTAVAKAVFEGKETTLDDLHIRYPTHVNDVAAACKGLAERKMEHCGLYGTWHFSGNEAFTKYGMAVEIARIFGLPHDHIKPIKKEDPLRPLNSRLNCIALEMMGLLKTTRFSDGIRAVLEPFKPNNANLN